MKNKNVRITKVFGLLELSDGTELDLDGKSIAKVREEIGSRRIVGYGRKYLGSEANVYVALGEKGRAISNLVQVRRLFSNEG